MEALKLKLKNETDYLNGQVAKYDKYINDSFIASIKGDQTDASRGDAVVEHIPDYAIGNIRLAIGQSKLFINERFKQFSNLMADSEAKRGEKEIKIEDLEGFWEMINYQIDDLKIKWNELENLHENNWIITETTTDTSSKPNIKNKPLSDKVNIYKNRKPASTKTATTTTATVSSTKATTKIADKPKAPVARSNFRDFLRSKQIEIQKNDLSNGDCLIVSKTNVNNNDNPVANDAIVVTAGDKEN